MARSQLVRSLLIAALMLGCFAWPAAVQACSCRIPDNPASGLRKSEAVFIGTVVGAVDLSQNQSWWNQLQRWLWGGASTSQSYDMRYTFVVQSAWKGLTTTEAIIYANSDRPGNCGLNFDLGARYLVYATTARSSHGELATSICTRTNVINNRGADLAYLANQPTLALTPAPPAAILWLSLCAILLVLVMLGSGGFFVFRRRGLKR